ncbi:hypothetical protein GW935_02950 [Candidatus Falkowbacteria bacterium]|nr:hypothetical protein [Candidatus Falkowbacteria bacterium]
MDKKVIYLGMFIGSLVGGYLPMLFGVSAFSMWSVMSGAVGGIFGIWLAYKIFN